MTSVVIKRITDLMNERIIYEKTHFLNQESAPRHTACPSDPLFYQSKLSYARTLSQGVNELLDPTPVIPEKFVIHCGTGITIVHLSPDMERYKVKRSELGLILDWARHHSHGRDAILICDVQTQLELGEIKNFAIIKYTDLLMSSQVRDDKVWVCDDAEFKTCQKIINYMYRRSHKRTWSQFIVSIKL